MTPRSVVAPRLKPTVAHTHREIRRTNWWARSLVLRSMLSSLLDGTPHPPRRGDCERNHILEALRELANVGAYSDYVFEVRRHHLRGSSSPERPLQVPYRGRVSPESCRRVTSFDACHVSDSAQPQPSCSTPQRRLPVARCDNHRHNEFSEPQSSRSLRKARRRPQPAARAACRASVSVRGTRAPRLRAVDGLR
jgi:hypothetical protein